MAAKKKVYAVRKGKVTGLFYSWAECKNAVDGFSGAEFKGFLTKEEAEAYLQGGKPAGVKSDAASGEKTDAVSEETGAASRDADSLTAYVDGSYSEALGRYSFGCILLLPKGEIVKKSGSGDHPESLAIRNVAGEMLGAMYAVKWALKNGYKSLEIHYDYMGIECWATGAWSAKNELTQKYAGFMQRQGRLIRISFVKVKAHTGNFYNEEVDQLAKAALEGPTGIPEV